MASSKGMFIESHNDANLVLLVVYGGACGMPDHFLTKATRRVWKSFLPSWWSSAVPADVQDRYTSRHDDMGPTRRRHIGSDELPVIPFRKREDLPLWDIRGGALIGIQVAAQAPLLWVCRLHWHGSDVVST